MDAPLSIYQLHNPYASPRSFLSDLLTIQHEKSRLDEQGPCKRDTHSPPSREVLSGSHLHLCRESKTKQAATTKKAPLLSYITYNIMHTIIYYCHPYCNYHHPKSYDSHIRLALASAAEAPITANC